MQKPNKRISCRSKITAALLSCLFVLTLGFWGPGVLAEELDAPADSNAGNLVEEEMVINDAADESGGAATDSDEEPVDIENGTDSDAAAADEGSKSTIVGPSKATAQAAELLVEAGLIKYAYHAKWQEKWGAYPDDGTNPDDYVYYVWRLSSTVTGATEKYTLTLDLGTTKNSSYGVIEGPAEIMGWRRGTTSDFTGDKGHDYSCSTLTRSNPTPEAKKTNMYVLTRSARNDIPVDGVSIRMRGKVTYSPANGAKKTITKTLGRVNSSNKYLVSDYKGPKGLTISKSGDTLKVKWTADPRNDSYTVGYSTSRLFHTYKYVNVDGRYADSITITGLDPDREYYVRVKAYRTFGGKRYSSKRSFSPNTTKALTVKKSTMKYNGVRFELRKRAGQKMFGYDTVQGGCTDGKFAYYTLYNRDKNNCKVAKVNMATMKVVKVSGKLGCRHGNGMAYNPNNNRLYITHTTNESRRITIVNANTLQVISGKTISIPTDLPGNTAYQRSKGFHFSGISYNPAKKQYAVLLRSTGRFLILNNNLKPLRIVKPSKKAPALRQGLSAYGEYILVISSPYGSRGTNLLTAYDWDGSYVTTVTVSGGYEIENTFIKDKRVYVTSYHSYYKSYKAKVKKTKRVKKKNKQGKYYYVKKTYYVYVTKQKLLRDNYIYKLYRF